MKYLFQCYMALKSCCKNWKNAFSMTNICLPKYDCHQAIKYFDEKMLFLQLVYAMFFKFCNFFVKSKLLCFFIAFMESQWLFLILYSLHLGIPSECKMNNPNLQGITILCLKWPQCYQLWPFYSSSIRFKTPKRVKFEYWRFWPAIFGKLTFFNNLWLLNIWWGW